MPEEYINTAVQSILLNYSREERAVILGNIDDNRLLRRINVKINVFRTKLILGWIKVG